MDQVESATTVFSGGPVWLGPGRRTRALAVRDGRLVALGDEALALRRFAAETVDLEGGLLLPAYSDGHCHPVQAGVWRDQTTTLLAQRAEIEAAGAPRLLTDRTSVV